MSQSLKELREEQAQQELEAYREEQRKQAQLDAYIQEEQDRYESITAKNDNDGKE